MGSVSILNLPNEMLTEIFPYLSPEDLVDNVRETCVRWSDLTYANALWRQVTFMPSHQMSDTPLLSYIEKIPQLKYFFLNHGKNSRIIIDKMCEYCDYVKSVIVKNKTETKNGSIADMLHTFRNMERFDVATSGLQLNLDFARPYGMFHSRSSVNMLTNEGLYTNNFILNRDVGFLPDIEVFSTVPLSKVHSVINKKRNEMKSLSVNCDVNADIFSLICTCKDLRYLFVCDTENEGPPRSLVPLANLTNLEILQLVGFWDGFPNVSPPNFEGVVFSHLKKLEVIQGGSLLEGPVAYVLSVCPKLTHLNV
jgi:hypothetical protein